ncbi:YecA family protein [Gulbenkiania mobilis]|uniref:YecA family protein n=1 Tax=Gulbenkiania mobilis TaxID=397457 RepID=A0ABY2D0Y4_GULMO|nr:uncharacterized protein EV669_101490 [Gulbenkiania mobilis]
MTAAAFDDADLTRLETLLTPLSQAGSTMRPDEVQGFFVALASGPDTLAREDWLSEVLGDAPAFENESERDELAALLQKLYDHTAAELAAGRMPEMILYAEEDSESPDFWPWCNAYLYTLDVVPTDWFEKADDEGFEDLLMPLMALGGMFEEEDGKVLMEFSEDELEGFREELPEAVLAVYQYWRAKMQAPKTVRRTAGKVGRNDPCPCGSGKKFKACCGE